MRTPNAATRARPSCSARQRKSSNWSADETNDLDHSASRTGDRRWRHAAAPRAAVAATNGAGAVRLHRSLPPSQPSRHRRPAAPACGNRGAELSARGRRRTPRQPGLQGQAGARRRAAHPRRARHAARRAAGGGAAMDCSCGPACPRTRNSSSRPTPRFVPPTFRSSLATGRACASSPGMSTASMGR